MPNNEEAEKALNAFHEAASEVMKANGYTMTSGAVDAGALAVFAAGRKAGMTEAAGLAQQSTNPSGHGSLNEGSRSQWYAHGRRDAADRILLAITEKTEETQ